MPRDEAHRLLGPDESDVEEDPYLPLITPFSLQRHSLRPNDYAQFANGKPTQWSHTRPSWHIRASLVRFFGPIRSLLFPTTARTACTTGLLMFMLCFAFCTMKPPSTPEAHPGPEVPNTGPAQGLSVENPIFKVGSILFRARNDTDTFIS